MSEMTWQKSSFSGDRDDCVELCGRNDHIAIRESDAPRTVINTTPARLRALIATVKASA
ncbi:DUF397 domain-containing protein [Streptomyces sp. NPDC026206]|uniref:DUF397 domain-containing protein n=1 Tax=Streptomyces sp. NPDC026206 TaxID=3157089 RepID=UPI0033E7D0F1